MTRYVSFISRLTGWNAIKSRVEQLGLEMTDEQIKEVYVLYRGEDGVALDVLADTSFTVPPRSRLWRISVPLPSTTATLSSGVSLNLPVSCRWRTDHLQ